MFRVINEYLAKVKIETDDDLKSLMNDYLEKDKNITKFCINENFNRYVVDIKLKKFTVKKEDTEFRKLISAIAYSYSQMSVRYNEGDRVRYRFVTCKEDKTGVYLDVIFS